MISLGFDIGGTTIKGGAIDERNTLVKKISRPTPKGDPAAMCAVIRSMADELTEGYDGINTLGVTVPGSVDAEGGIIDAWNIGLRNVPLKKMISEAIPAGRVIVRNDADAAAAAELATGALKGVETGVMLTLGTGVGGCLILGGKLFHGGLDRGTELGHAMMQRGGAICGCGHKGCIETLCSATALKRLAEKACAENKGMIARKAAEGALVDAKLLMDCAKAGDEAASELFASYTDALADAIASFVNVIDPQVIVIGGGVSGAGDQLLEPLRRLVPGKCFFGSCGEIKAAEAGNDAGMIGAVI